MNFKSFYLSENEKASWLGSCINFRRKSPENEKIWQNIMAIKKKISEKEFLKNVTIEDLLDHNETWEDWKETNSDDHINLYKSGDYYFIQNKGFEYLWKKNSINEQIITEASQEYNIAKFLSDKIIKQLRDMSYTAKTHPERYKDTKQKWVGSHEIPMKKFIKDLNIPKGKLFDFLSIMKLYLDYGELDKFSKTPFLKVYGGRKAGGYYEPKGDFGIHIPFIDSKTGLPFTQYFDDFYSTILHELTHAIQDFQGTITKEGTAKTNQEEWFLDKSEREAYIHEMYRHLQEYVSGLVSEMKNFRTNTDYSKADYSEYVKTSNKLRLMFESIDTFKKSVRIDAREIFMNNGRNKDRFDYISTNHRDVYNKFLEDSYSELKKEFKNVLPTKKLSYTGEKK